MTINYEFTIHGCACIYVCVSGLRYSFIIVTHLMHIKTAIRIGISITSIGVGFAG